MTTTQTSTLDGKTVAIIGYGSQGHAHALNLKDSGVSVVVGLRPTRAAWPRRRSTASRSLEPADAASQGDLVMMLVPDELHGQVWESGVKDGIAPGNTLLFGHGFSIHYEQIVPPPTSTSPWSRRRAPGTWFAASTSKARACRPRRRRPGPTGDALQLALAYAKGIGCTRGGVIETSFKDETETDLFGEQAVLCGGVTALVRAGYETLVDAGYDPRLAYFECLHELKLIVDLMYEKGIAGMRYSISKTAEYGDLTRGTADHRATRTGDEGDPRGDPVGDFAREWIAEYRAGQENFNRLLAERRAIRSRRSARSSAPRWTGSTRAFTSSRPSQGGWSRYTRRAVVTDANRWTTTGKRPQSKFRRAPGHESLRFEEASMAQTETVL